GRWEVPVGEDDGRNRDGHVDQKGPPPSPVLSKQCNESATKDRPDGHRYSYDRTEGSKGASAAGALKELLNEPDGLRVQQAGPESGNDACGDQHWTVERQSRDQRAEAEQDEPGYEEFGSAEGVTGSTTGNQQY